MNEYEIMTEGHVDRKRLYGFEQLQVRHLENGTTLITGEIADQSMLFALLGRIRDLGLKLLSIQTRG